jgi:CHRD domain
MIVALTASTASAQIVRMTAKLTGGNEKPNAVTTGAFGTGEVTVDVTAQTVSWVIQVFNLPSGATVSHFHVGSPEVAGPIVINIAIPANISNDFALSGTAGPADFVARADQGIRSWEDTIQAVLGENTYLNVHSAVNPGGEVRGQVLLVK